MNKKISIILILALILLGGFFLLKQIYPNNILIPYSPEGPSYQNDENKNQLGIPTKALDQGADASRKATIVPKLEPNCRRTLACWRECVAPKAP